MTLYEALIERDLDAAAAAAREFDSVDELWIAVTRFAVLAYSPSQHGKRAVMACRAAHELRDAIDFRAMTIECAKYAAASRPPWSEPPMLDTPIEMPPREACIGDALLMLDTVDALAPLLGEKGRYALARMVKEEVAAKPIAPRATLDELMRKVVESRGAPDAVQAVFWSAAAKPPLSISGGKATALTPYSLARDFAQTLLALLYANRLPTHHATSLIKAVHDNLEHGESFAAWSFA